MIRRSNLFGLPFIVFFIVYTRTRVYLCAQWRSDINLGVIAREVVFICFYFWDKASHWPEIAHCARLASSEPSLYSGPSAEIINTSQLFQLFYPGLSNSGPQASVSAGILLPTLFLEPIQLSVLINTVELKHSHIHTFTYYDCFCSTAT